MPLATRGYWCQDDKVYDVSQSGDGEVPIVCAVSAPSSLAVEVARRFRMTLVGFLRERSATSIPIRNA